MVLGAPIEPGTRQQPDPHAREGEVLTIDGSLGAEALWPAAECALREWTVSWRVNRTGVGDDDPL
jgi:hypothetical protein